MPATAATCLIVFITLLLSGSVLSSSWKYGDEDNWPQQCHEGQKQSPIALSEEISDEKDFPIFIFENYDKNFPVKSKNNGHSAEVRLHVNEQPQVTGGDLPGTYVFDHLHFHWESEHTIDGYRYPLELHLVHYSKLYQNIAEAIRHKNGVAVFSVLFDLSPDNYREVEPLINAVDKFHDKINQVEELFIKIADYLPRDTAGFYRYNGSLTTPNCTEGVIWTVFTNTVPISKQQVKTFGLLRTESNQLLPNNYRSLQQLNGRKVFLKVSPIRSSSNKPSFNHNKTLILLLCIYLLSI